MPLVIAAADIGSNTAHLLVAEVQGEKLKRLSNESEWLSLGEVVSREDVIPNRLVEQLSATLLNFRRIAEDKRADHFYCFATEAMRRAQNHEAVVKELKKRTGIAVELITPTRETELSLKGTSIDAAGESPFLLTELGGGSMQVALCADGKILRSDSLPVGTGALIARASVEQPPSFESVVTLDTILNDAVKQLGAAWSTRRVVSAGGVARGIWRAMHPDGARQIHLRELEHLAWDTRRLDVHQIIGRYGVKQKRAQTLLPGSMAYAHVLRWAGHSELTVSEFGVREGAVLEIAQRRS